MTRRFDAPRRIVFAALTRPDRLTRWHGARGWQVIECEVDLRINGAWRLLSRGPRGELMTQRGAYREIVPGHRLVYTESCDHPWFPGECLVTVALDETGGATTLTMTLRFSSQWARERARQSPMEADRGEGFDRLGALLRPAPVDHAP
jgi:uncharacterized protein YndB with AHSA1/START domain